MTRATVQWGACLPYMCPTRVRYLVPHMVPWAQPGVILIPECRAKTKTWASLVWSHSPSKKRLQKSPLSSISKNSKTKGSTRTTNLVNPVITLLWYNDQDWIFIDIFFWEFHLPFALTNNMKFICHSQCAGVRSGWETRDTGRESPIGSEIVVGTFNCITDNFVNHDALLKKNSHLRAGAIA